MKWSWRLGRIAGIDVYMHGTFLLLLAWVAIRHYLPSRDVAAAVGGIGFILAVFGIVVLHELGHALAARRFGIRTRDITLLPIGGLARLERMPEDPRQELIVALAGPAVNVLLAGLLVIALVSAHVALSPAELTLVGGGFLAKMLWINVALAVFNLIPAFPMDGGRVLRALLAMRMEYVRATQIASNFGQAIALVLGFVGLFSNPFLVFIALFVWMGASSEASLVQMRSALGGLPVTRAMVTEFRTVSSSDTIQSVADHVLAGFQQDFPVVDDGRLVGVLTRTGLVRALAEAPRDAPLREAMEQSFETADPSEMLEAVFQRLQTCNCRSIPVVRDGTIVGLLTTDNVGEFLMIQAALRRA